MADPEAGATDVVWNLFYCQNVSLGTFGTDLDRLVNLCDEWKFSIFGRFWNLSVGIVLDGRHPQRDKSVTGA
mgnify:CR=1 FL=1